MRVCLCTVLFCLAGLPLFAAPLSTGDGLSVQADGLALSALSLDGQPAGVAGVAVVAVDPLTGAPAEGVAVSGAWTAVGDTLRLDGVVTAEGADDRVADLLVRVPGATLPLGTMASDPLLLPRALLSKLPLVSLRGERGDALALAVPPEALAIHEFRERDGAVELRFPFGFTSTARPDLAMRAPFSVVLYRTDPRWHFRSALDGYYRRFPAAFESFVDQRGTPHGGWFFAAPVPDLPNPQHFQFYEGGPGGWDEARARGLGTYPYRESSSATVALSGAVPQSYDEAMARFAELEREKVPALWTPQQTCALDAEVKRSGEQSLLADAGEAGQWVGALQTVTLDEPVTAPIVVRGYSRAEDIEGGLDNSYSIYVDVTYDDGSYLFGQCAQFRPGTHDWELAEHTIEPAKPVRSLRVFCLLRQRPGRAWFDDIHVGPADAPETNWLGNPGFETLAPRTQLTRIRDNVVYDRDGRSVVRITDNLSSDVAPTQPLNLLRFTLNVDPDLPSTPEHPSVASGELAYFDAIFNQFPELAGAYIDSVSAWVASRLNHRREHWPASAVPFTYDPETRQVAPHGRFAMRDYLSTLQQRYHPRGKAIFTNIHTHLDSFPLYTVSDVCGIESSRFGDLDSLFFYRAAGGPKPVLLMNFTNLHGLDDRATAERFHLNTAQWGLLPSVGRNVQAGYITYGDVTHTWMPATIALSEAGWQPVPLATGANAERFGDPADGAVWFTVRAPAEPASETLTIEPAALAGLGDDLVVLDAVTLHEVSAEPGDGLRVRLTHGRELVTLLRVTSRRSAMQWLLDQARRHAVAAARVHGTQPERERVTALRQALAEPLAEDTAAVLSQVRAWRHAVSLAHATQFAADEDLYATSERRELEQADMALSALAMLAARVRVVFGDPGVVRPGQPATIGWRVEAPEPVSAWLEGERRTPRPYPVSDRPTIVPSPALGRMQSRALPPRAPEEATLVLAGQGVAELTTWLLLRDDEGLLAELPRLDRVWADEAVTLTATLLPDGRAQIALDPPAPPGGLTLRAAVAPALPLEPAELALPAGAATGEIRVGLPGDGIERTLTLRALGPQGAVLGETALTWFDEPAPTADVARADRGATVTVDSSFNTYRPEPLIDGEVSVEGRHWTDAAWASADNDTPHWVEVRFAQPVDLSEVRIYWAVDGGRANSSPRYRLSAEVGGQWRTLAEVDDATRRSVSTHAVDVAGATALRLDQPSGGGPDPRPGLMWIREIVAVPRD